MVSNYSPPPANVELHLHSIILEDLRQINSLVGQIMFMKPVRAYRIHPRLQEKPGGQILEIFHSASQGCFIKLVI